MLRFEGDSVVGEGSPGRLVDIMMENPAELNHEVASVRSGMPTQSNINVCSQVLRDTSLLINL